MRGIRYGSVAVVLALALTLSVKAEALDPKPPRTETDDEVLRTVDETDRPALVDYGYGPGRPPPAPGALQGAGVSPLAAPAAGSAAATQGGVFGPPLTWPLIPIHAVLLADGRVMSYGTNEKGQQGGQFIYDVWNPAQSTGGDSHLTLPNGTKTDIFCSGQSVIAASGEVLITGGDLTIGGNRNYSIPDTTIFNPQINTLRKAAPMAYARWYPTIVDLPDGDMLILGGRQDFTPGSTGSHVPAPTPEVFRPSTGAWRTLPGAKSDEAFGKVGWYYPSGFQAPNGKVFVVVKDGKMFYVDPAGNGTITKLAPTTLPGETQYPRLMFQPGRILSLRNNRKVVVIDLNGAQPVWSETAGIDQVRYWSNTTVLADGKVLVNGGSAVSNKATGVAYDAQIWDPATGQWTQGPNAVKMRLYHSIALLLPDGSVLTGGGGAPGPIRNLNAEIYYPAYLFDGLGQWAARPSLIGAPASAALGQPFIATVGAGDVIGRVTLVRTGSVTHALNTDQRFSELSFWQSAPGQLTINAPPNPNVAPQGYYMLFVFNTAGVPSVARIIRM